MKFRHLIILLACCWITARADFSTAAIELHPYYPLDGPYIIEIRGEWPTDCHPGEQKPVIRDYDGSSVLIEFDIVVVHITCNQRPTPYRVLVDMSDVVGTVEGIFPTLDVTVRFGDAELHQSVMLDCGPIGPCQKPPADDIRPSEGIFHNPELEKQGLVLARQNQWMAAYPLTYDETGSSEWLFAGGEIVQDAWFAPLYALVGGQCPNCPSPGESPRLEKVGKLTLLADSEGILQVRFDDGPFAEYRHLVFGYKTFHLGVDGQQSLADLTGRWGISENRGTDPPLGDLSAFLPGAFEMVVEELVTADGGTSTVAQVTYRVARITGELLGRLVCAGDTNTDGTAPKCAFTDPDDAAEPLFFFYPHGPSSLSIEYGRAVIAVGVAPGGKAVRID